MSLIEVWALYKEVQAYYEQGLEVPDDVTLLFADDNFGTIRRLPTEAENERSGGIGVSDHYLKRLQEDWLLTSSTFRFITTSNLLALPEVISG